MQKNPFPLERPVSQPRLIVASDPAMAGEGGNPIIFKALFNCFGRFGLWQ